MKRSKFSDRQIIDAVKRVESGIGVPDICRELGVSSATFYKCRAKYGGMDVSHERARRREPPPQEDLF
jgi:putative transposase